MEILIGIAITFGIIGWLLFDAKVGDFGDVGYHQRRQLDELTDRDIEDYGKKFFTRERILNPNPPPAEIQPGKYFITPEEMEELIREEED